MIARMSGNISSFFVARGIISVDDRDVYLYCFEVLLSTLTSFLTLAILAIASNTVVMTAVFLIGFVPLRRMAGGYHANSHFRCFTTLLITYSVFLLLLYLLPQGFRVPATILSIVLSTAAVFRFAPSEDTNKPLLLIESVRLKKRSRIISVCSVVVVCLLTVFVPDKRYALSLALGYSTVGVFLLVSFVKVYLIEKIKREQKGERNNEEE